MRDRALDRSCDVGGAPGVAVGPRGGRLPRFHGVHSLPVRMGLRGGDRVAAGHADPGASYVQQFTEPAVYCFSLSAPILSAGPGGAVDTTGLSLGRTPCFVAFSGADRNRGRRTGLDLGSPPQPR